MITNTPTTIDLDKQPTPQQIADAKNMLVLTLCPDTFAALYRLIAAIDKATVAMHRLVEQTSIVEEQAEMMRVLGLQDEDYDHSIEQPDNWDDEETCGVKGT
jgi:hypothetical protein